MIMAADKKVLDFFMDDSTWEKIPGKNDRRRRADEKPEAVQHKETKRDKEQTDKESSSQGSITAAPKDETGEKIETDKEAEFGEVDYAILKSVTLGFKTIKEIADLLQIRTMVIEKHIYKLTKAGFIKYYDYCVITSKGKQAIEDYVKSSSEDVWRPIDEFIASVMEARKERNLKLQKLIDIILLISIIFLIMLVIYFGIFT